MGDSDSEGTTAALDDVAYLSRSPNRVNILAVLADRAVTRRALAEHTGTSRTTLDRIVNELEERGWAERTADGTYTATPQGTHLQREFQSFRNSVLAIRRLGDTLEWLPTGELEIGLEHFADAVVRRPTHDDPVETVDLMIELIQEATHHRALTHLVPPVSLSEAILDGVESGRLTADGVLTADSVDFLREAPDRRRRWASIADAVDGDLFRYDGTIPCNLWIIDEAVLIKKSGPDSIAEAYGVPIVCRNEAVLDWANQLVDTYQAEATQVDLE